MLLEKLSPANTQTLTETVKAEPTKAFFVDMLTRDIELTDAILDLLDNCTDGVQRTLKALGKNIEEASYDGFYANITIESNYFSIEDNCGGIATDRAKNIAFRMGRPPGILEDDELYTVGTYGIGMKRALFKLGRRSRVTSQTDEEAFQVIINPKWFDSETWELPFQPIGERVLAHNGTVIEVTDLREGVKTEISGTLEEDLYAKISQLFSYIIKKGFTVRVNKSEVFPKPLELRIGDLDKLDDTKVVAPYVYEATIGEVKVDVTVGFYRPIPTEQEIEDENEGKRYSSSEAGWTIICNDRVVVYCDKGRLTGWGISGIPSYHTQFIAIAGVVFFKSKNAASLPLTTTKRGIDAGSDMYLRVKDRMMEGLRLFTHFTNRWKGEHLEQSKKLISETRSFTPRDAIAVVSRNIPEERWTKVVSKDSERRFVPDLPMPEIGPQSKSRRITFSKNADEVESVARYLEAEDANPSEVGLLCFDFVLARAEE